MSPTRRAYEAGHRPKYLVVVDDTDECDRAIYYAARRAVRTGAGMVMLAVTPPLEAPPLLGVAEVMQAEATEEATERLDKAAARARAVAGIDPEHVIKDGAKADAVLAVIDEDEDIASLVLAAGTGSEGPGPLVSLLVGKAGPALPIPVTIVPGHLGDTEIDALA